MKIIYIKVITKAGTLTQKKWQWLKEWILDDTEIPVYSIKVYHLPEEESVEDEKFKDETGPLRSRIPVFIIGSNWLKEVSGKKLEVISPYVLCEGRDSRTAEASTYWSPVDLEVVI